MNHNPEDATLTVAMAPDEVAMFERHLKPGAVYLEFGSGGSTAMAIGRGVRLCHSVESDPAWIAKLRNNATIQTAESEGRLVFHTIDIGPTMSWGMPANRSRIEHWPNYYLTVWDKIGAAPDLVLIDGRFRVACGLAALLTCGGGTTILMHDFFDGSPIRRNYRNLLHHAEIVEQQGNLVSLRAKAESRPTALLAALAAHGHDFS